MVTKTLDIHQLIYLLEVQPELRAELRRLVLTDELLALPALFKDLAAKVDALAEAQRWTEATLAELAEAQRRTEARVEELAEAQRRTDEAIKALAEAQRRSEEEFRKYREASEARFARIEAALAELAEAQRETDRKVDRLAAEVQNLARTVGATMESEAEDWVCYLLEEKGYEILDNPVQIRMDGEVDVAVPAAKDGQKIWAVVEAKTRLSRREIADWANRMRSEGFRRRLAQYGVPGPYLVYVYGLRVDAGCDQAARRFGVGLITDRGERVPPGPLLPAAKSE